MWGGSAGGGSFVADDDLADLVAPSISSRWRRQIADGIAVVRPQT